MKPLNFLAKYWIVLVGLISALAVTVRADDRLGVVERGLPVQEVRIEKNEQFAQSMSAQLNKIDGKLDILIAREGDRK